MKISLDWIHDFVDLPGDVSPQQIGDGVTMSTVEVEKVIDTAAPLEHIVVGRIKTVEKHSDNETLKVVDVDSGNGTVRAVSDATNLAPGMKVALALEGATIRDAAGKERPVQRSTYRGVETTGILCSAAACGVSDAFETGETEILDLAAIDADPGTPLAKAIGYDDYVLEIDNKSLTNRPDLWGHHGMARELAAQYERPLRQPKRFGDLPPAAGDFEVIIDCPDTCRRYTATRITGVAATPSPAWMRARLAKVGQRSINLLVDLTNYVMFETGQPIHAFDARDLENRIVVRRGKKGEHVVLLDGTDCDLDSDAMVIADHEKPIALAGIMGGDLGVRDDTTELWLEAANFEPNSVRRSAKRYKMRTESATRYEKGIDVQRVELAVQLFTALVTEIQPTARVVQHVDTIASLTPPITVDVPVSLLHSKIGLKLDVDVMRGLLERLQFGCTVENDVLHVSVPSWRATGDVSIPEDIVEEVARLYGYENLPFTPPTVQIAGPIIAPARRLDRRVKEYLAFRAGMREVVTYPWVTAQAIDAAGMSNVETIGLAHPPVADMRLAPSLIPQLLANVAANLRHHQAFRIFELNRVFKPSFTPSVYDDREQLPVQPHYAAGAIVGDDAATLFLQMKGILEKLDRVIQIEPLTFTDNPDVPWGDATARLGIASGGKQVGVLAVASARARRKAGIRRAEVAMFEIDVDALTPLASRTNKPEALPHYPQIEFDLSLIVASPVRWADAHEIALHADPLIRDVTFVAEYVGPQVPAGHKSLSIRLYIRSDEGTLVREQAIEVAGKARAQLIEKLGATVGEIT